MISHIWKLATAALLASAIAFPASAQSAPTPRAALDPNQKICETHKEVGSRLAQKKVCATRAEWAARKAADRHSTEEIQRGGTIGCIITDGGARGGGVTSC